MQTFNDEMDMFQDWVSAPFVKNIPGWKALVALLVFLIIVWFVFDNLSIIKQAI